MATGSSARRPRSSWRSSLRRTCPVRLPAEAVYQPGEPPHAQADFVIDPASEKLPEQLRDKDNPSSSSKASGECDRSRRVEGERFTRKNTSAMVHDQGSEEASPRADRLLGPKRDVQFLITQMLRDKADLSAYVQNEGGKEGKINLLEEKERQLTRFPDHVNVETAASEPPETKWYNISNYDVIVAFDFDWNELTVEQTRMVQGWVDLQAGGLLFVAGHIFTKHLARPDADDKFRPITDILPVIPGDPDLSAEKRTATMPWRLEFENLSGDLDFMKLDDSLPTAQTGWEMFFTGREERDDKARVIRGFYNYFRSATSRRSRRRSLVTPTRTRSRCRTARPPWIAVMQYGQGRTGWVGSPEMWRCGSTGRILRALWTKFIRYLAAGRRANNLAGESHVGIRAAGRLQPSSSRDPRPVAQGGRREDGAEDQVRAAGTGNIRRNQKLVGEAAIEGQGRVPQEIHSGVPDGAEEGDPFKGFFQIAKLASPDKFPTGTCARGGDPSSTETLKQSS